MAITCEWKKPLGTCYSEYDVEKRFPLTIYGGGNSLAVICNEQRALNNFIIDKKHFERCEYRGTEYTDIIIYRDRRKDSKILIELLLSANFEFTVINKMPSELAEKYENML